MHIYRYRSAGLLSQKGLLYDEIYFASKDELNDPIEMQSKFEFPDKSDEIWTQLLNQLWENAEYVSYAVGYFSSISPISYESLLNDFQNHKRFIIGLVMKETQMMVSDFDHLNHLLDQLHSFFLLYEPSSGYSVSFSKTNNEMLMWSHYSSSHTGYCLIFRPVNGVLNQCPVRLKDNLHVSKGHSSSIPKGIKVESIHYDNNMREMDAFRLFPSIYTNYSFDSESDRLKHHSDVSTQLLTKNECWDYEQECRLLLPQPGKWISGQSSYTPYQRLFYYDFRQVIGIIFGARMPQEQKEDIKEIINSKLAKRYSNIGSNPEKDYIFDFLFQEAEICPSSRQIIIVDLDLVSMGTKLDVDSEYYNRQLEKWKRAEGVVMESGSYRNESIP
jgi:hypothetical protein